MTESRLESEWDRTAMLVAKIHNVNCTRRGDMITDLAQVNPLRKPAMKQQRMTLAEMREMATGRKSKWGRNDDVEKGVSK